jgi:hypothetical protein
MICRFLESEYYFQNVAGQNKLSLKNICVILLGKYKEKKDLQLSLSNQE